jgi:xanthine dehydrogenase accessory factor
MTRTDLLLRAEHLRSQRTPFVLATVVRAQRPTSAKAGDSALVLPDGTLDGFVGGTCAESTVRTQGLRLLETGQSMLLRILPEPDGEPHEDAAEGVVTVANPCLSGGALEIFLEANLPPTLVRVFGDGPIARALVQVGQSVGYEVAATADPDQPIPGDAAAVVVASHGRHEEHVLTAALRSDVPYIALVASRRRAEAVLGGLGLTTEERARVRSPAGLDIGARTPPEIALSIVAEIIAGRPRPAPRTATAAAGAATTAVDPVCGMTVAVAPAFAAESGGAASLQLTYADRTWFFCGPGCRTAFADDPKRYAGE